MITFRDGRGRAWRVGGGPSLIRLLRWLRKIGRV